MSTVATVSRSVPESQAMWRRGSPRSVLARLSAATGLILVLAAVPFFQGPDTTYKLTNLCVLIVLASMWNLLAGFGGMITVGLQAFIGIGAYSLLFLTDRGLSPYLSVAVAGLVAALVSLPMSLLAFRLTGGYFAIGTWVMSEVCRLIVVQFDSLGGGGGRSLLAFNGVAPAQRQANIYWVALAAIIVTLGGIFLLLRSRTGLGLTAIRDDAVSARSAGVYTTRSRRLVFVLGAAGCGGCGALLLCNSLRVQPDSAFSVSYSASMIFCVVIGGVGTIEGPVLGALAFFLLQDTFANYGTSYLIVIGVIAMVMAIWVRQGIWGFIHERTGLGLFPTRYTVVPARDRGSP